MEAAGGIDIPTTALVVLGMVAALAAVVFARSFSNAIGGELGGAFRWVMIGTVIFALTRVDDLLKVTGVYVRMGLDYQRVLWVPHHLGVLVCWALIAFGFYKMAATFRA
jgi:hypothetical protein